MKRQKHLKKSENIVKNALRHAAVYILYLLNTSELANIKRGERGIRSYSLTFPICIFVHKHYVGG